MLKPNFQSIISQTNNVCSLLSLFLAKLLLLDRSCENTFTPSIVTALTACPFSIQKCAKMSVFYVKTAKIRWRLGFTPSEPILSVVPPPPPLPNPGCATACNQGRIQGDVRGASLPTSHFQQCFV